MEPKRFFHLAFKVPDLEEVSQFYRTHFGADIEERETNPGDPTAVSYIALTLADKRLYLFEQAPYEATGLVERIEPGFLHFGVVVEDASSAVDALRENGVEVLMEPTKVGDLRVAFVLDPTGTRVELLEHL